MLIHAKRLLVQAGLFGLSKSAVLFAPFLAAWTLSNAQYGAVEWWLSVSMALGPMLALGMHGVIAYGTLGGPLASGVQTATAYVLIACATVMAASWLAFHLVTEPSLAAAAVIGLQSALVVLQLATSARLKALGKGAVASIFESALYLTLLFGLASHWLGVDFMAFYVQVMALCGVLMIGVLLKVSQLPGREALRLGALRGVFRHSYKFLLGGVLMGAFMGGPRIVLGLMDSDTTVAAFSIVFRWLSIAIVVHQFINTVFFRRVYGSAVAFRSAAIMACVTLVALAAAVIATVLWFVPGAELGLPWPLSEDRWLVRSMALVMVLWATSASLEGVLASAARPGLQTLCVAAGISVFVLFVGIGYLTPTVNFKGLITLAWVAGFLMIVGMQLYWAVKLELFTFRLENVLKVGLR
ncbi:hypothetical protein [Pseudomonas sp. 2835]|uniref:hypothetical protein n=1 Tax=Pseudomonas sp. 2835 TaxID=3156451 RepID=UPI003D1C5124